MIYITGDTHGIIDMKKMISSELCQLTRSDYVIIAGDCGVLFSEDETALNIYKLLPYTVLFVDGNHENFDMLAKYEVEEWNGGKVHRISDNIIHLMRGQVFCLDGIRYFTFGGALSYDKDRRTSGVDWWPDEQPNLDEYTEALNNLEKVDYRVDYIITHDCPDVFLFSVRGCDKIMFEGYRKTELNIRLDDILKKMDFRHWFFAHYHIDNDQNDEFTVLFADVVDISDERFRRWHNGASCYSRYLSEKALPLMDKKISLVGDSVSTYEGFNPPNHNIHYRGLVRRDSGVNSVNNTWWMNVIHYFGAELLANNSCAGSCVSGIHPFAAYKKKRLRWLSNGVENPDVILVCIGTHDFEKNHFLGNGLLSKSVLSFKGAYNIMLKRMKQMYPNAQIICSTLFQNTVKNNHGESFFRANRCGKTLNDFNIAIREMAQKHGCMLVDLAQEVNYFDTYDGLHPNRLGMKTIASAWIDTVKRVSR